VTDKQTAAKTVPESAPVDPQAAAVVEQDREPDSPSEPATAEAPEPAMTHKPVAPLFKKAIDEAGGVAAAPVDAASLRGMQGVPVRRRSARLTVIKFVLPVVALVTVGYLVYWWYIHNREAVINVVTPDKPSANPPMITVNNFKYNSTDSQNRPYTITADSAAQPQDKALDIINLTRPQANFTLSGNHWMTITADKGVYHRSADSVDLNGNVKLDHDNGMTFHTDSAQIDMKAKIAAGSDPVQGQNDTSEINSQGFRILDDGNVIIFTGKTLLKLHAKGKDGSE
jgi:lipopolysaccharide export system protein LptC